MRNSRFSARDSSSESSRRIQDRWTVLRSVYGETAALAAAIMGIWLLISATLASRNITKYFVLPLELGLSFMKAGLVAPEFSGSKRLVFVKGHWSIATTTMARSLYDEFGVPTSASIAAQTMLAVVLRMVLRDIRSDTVRYVEFNAPINATKDEYVLDMKGIKALIDNHVEFRQDEVQAFQLTDTNWKNGVWNNQAARKGAGFFTKNFPANNK